MSTGYVYDDLFLEHYAQGHVESPDRLLAIMKFLKREGILSKMHNIPSQEASTDDLLLVHSQEMVEKVKLASEQAPTWLDPDTYVAPNSYSIAKCAVGSGIKLVSEIEAGRINNGIALIRPPGHHATFRQSMGFCLFNNIAIAARYLIKNCQISKVAIIDWDVHHGNGTQDIFYHDPRVFYMSLHLSPHYPGTGSKNEKGEGKGKNTTVNFPLSYNCSNNEYMDSFDEGLEKIRTFEPDFLLISVGFDSHVDDPLGGLPLNEQDFNIMTSKVCQIAKDMGHGKVASFLEGGYNLHTLASSVSAHLQAFLECE